MIYLVEFARTGEDTRPALFIEAPTLQILVPWLKAARFRHGWAFRLQTAPSDATPDLRIDDKGQWTQHAKNLEILFAYMGGKRP